MRNRFGMVAAGALLAAVLSVTLASAWSPSTRGPDLDAAPAPPPTVAPIQQLTFALQGTGVAQGDQQATASVASVGAKVGQVPGFCHLHS
ncbi:MAG TPA: hypothetical protein VGR74_23345 [Actinomycetota bacterium]|nr:hypothetical protein [Actinomycetota bacterium]